MTQDFSAEVTDMLENAEAAASFLKSFTHPSRLMILCALVEGERSVRDLEDALGLRQPGLSQQIASLREAGFIVGRKESKHVYYRLADGRVADFITQLHKMFCETPKSAERAEND